VATCDMATFLEDVDLVSPAGVPGTEQEYALANQRLASLGIVGVPSIPTWAAARPRLLQSVGCLASAILYLHENQIRHKDLKPMNILLSCDGLWVTDFGTSTDFSELSQSTSEGCERGTPKYFAPEVSAFEPNGRSADIFSLGCIFLEIVASSNNYSLYSLKHIRQARDCSFHANIESVIAWLDGFISIGSIDQFLMCLVRLMLRPKPQTRPTALQVKRYLRLLETFKAPLSTSTTPRLFSGFCCGISSDWATTAYGNIQERRSPGREMRITWGNTHKVEPWAPERNTWLFFVWPSLPGVIEKVYIFLHPSEPDPIRALIEPPFQFEQYGSWGTYEIGILLILKPEYSWLSPKAGDVPGGQKNGMLPLSWRLQFAHPHSETSNSFYFS